jgi:hypothetical protein
MPGIKTFTNSLSWRVTPKPPSKEWSAFIALTEIAKGDLALKFLWEFTLNFCYRIWGLQNSIFFNFNTCDSFISVSFRCLSIYNSGAFILVRVGNTQKGDSLFVKNFGGFRAKSPKICSGLIFYVGFDRKFIFFLKN